VPSTEASASPIKPPPQANVTKPAGKRKRPRSSLAGLTDLARQARKSLDPTNAESND
jgi:hypothetical protein